VLAKRLFIEHAAIIAAHRWAFVTRRTSGSIRPEPLVRNPEQEAERN